MSKIKILSEHLANQIAAGEVIERPASVVKEFIENSIDAQARNISIQVEGDGTRLLRVIDDGVGMDQDDVLLCLERHATSKLTDSVNGNGQLSGIRTLGFRGEAIPSIASVAKLVITSRPETMSLGTRIEVRFGKVIKVHESGCRRGTMMEMRDLFGNLPARKKFLKTVRTELFHIEEVVKNYCLAKPGLGISYTVNNTPVFNLPAEAETLEDRVKWLSGHRAAGSLLQIDSKVLPGGEAVTSLKDSVKITGYLLPPDESSGPAVKLRTFVNGRAVSDRMITHAVKEGLAGFLMKGRKPAGALFVSLSSESVDVNVHPAKQEVRFHKPNSIHQLVMLAVRHAIEHYQDDLKFGLFGSPQLSTTASQTQEPTEKGPIEMFSDTFRKEELQSPIAFSKCQPTHDQESLYDTADKSGCMTGETSLVFHAGTEVKINRQHTVLEPDFEAGDKSNMQHGTEPTDQCDSFRTFPTAVKSRIGLHAHESEALVPIGQLMDLYILCESTGGRDHSLVVIDQHAAHERILFENLKKQFAEKRLSSQSLLFPEIIEYNLDQIQILKKHRQEIEKLGIDVEEFGEESYVVKAVPTLLIHLSPQEIMAAVVEQFAIHDTGGDTEPGGGTTARINNILASMACKAAVKAGRSLTPEEIDELLKQMREADVFSHCPHGRPVFKSFTAAEVKKWFYRT